MPRNVEIKARLADAAELDALDARLHARTGRSAERLQQDDSFFRCTHGRLKLRRFGQPGAGGSAELIAYLRADARGPKTSTYTRCPVADADALHATLQAGCGLLGRVRKARRVHLVGRTRVHLDAVEGLGAFLELEVVLRDGEATAAGEAEAHSLMAWLGIAPAQLVATAYLDLLADADAAADPAAAAAPGTAAA